MPIRNSEISPMSLGLRYFFDPGSGICLWAQNDEAKQHLGYAVEHWDLPLSENTKRYLQHLIAWFDISIDWESPGNPGIHWSGEERARFQGAAAQGLALLKRELSTRGYIFKDETGS
jgi:hypothetical protein